ncbi:MAG: carbohydrate binding family 9 domain-containing protein [Gemmatimonadales bacterium]|nr:carbohydrate binding family 9 domain-containing protein [Gemmatimonadales bacterium]
MHTLLLALALVQDPTPAYSGRSNAIRVRPPRQEAAVTVDGRLDEPAWTRAAHLTDFSQYQPVDGRPAEDPTEVLVWYSPDAIYFGIRARETHGDVVRATRANRDNISSEDHVQILLDTYNARRLAYLFGVNALGVQQDGTRSDQYGGGAGGRSATGGGTSDINPLDGNVDLNPDYTFESRGRLVDGGYEIEVRIPFKSLPYQDRAVQTWGLNVLRRVQHSGFQDSWAPAVRGNSSFLGQSGSLEELRDLRRGLVLEVTPTATARLDGSPSAPGWDYRGDGEFGADVRWGIRQNLTLNGTFNPDFSQVEADVGQVLLNERFALFYPEKRPFFLDGLDLFDTPNQLIYTRRIVAPRAGVKLAGKLGRTNIATLVAADDSVYSWNGRHTPVFGVARVRTDLSASSTAGFVLTSREDGSDHSRLAGVDLRVYHSKLYFVELQAAQSWTDSAGSTRRGPLLQAAWDRTGRGWGFHYTLAARSPGFTAATGFVNRTGYLEARLFNRLSVYGKPGGFFQSANTFFSFARLWGYSNPGDGAIEGNEGVNTGINLRGGWQVGGSIGRNFFNFDPASYGGYEIELAGGALAPFTVPRREDNLFGWTLRATTPTFRQFTAALAVTRGETPIFREAAPGRSFRIDGSVDLRPTAALRTSVQVSRLALDRARDGSRFSTETIPRVKVEYQLNRALFLRFVGQYSARSRAPLEDREGNPIFVGGVQDTGSGSNEFRVDWLFSYRPTPGTLLYLGYGATLEEPNEFRFRDLTRTTDGFFGKVSYLFRM